MQLPVSYAEEPDSSLCAGGQVMPEDGFGLDAHNSAFSILLFGNSILLLSPTIESSVLAF